MLGSPRIVVVGLEEKGTKGEGESADENVQHMAVLYVFAFLRDD